MFLILYLHQTTTSSYSVRSNICCFLSCIYIKPQHLNTLITLLELFLILYLHQTTTPLVILITRLSCFLSCIYIKPQLPANNADLRFGCFLSCIYIKPQLTNLLILMIFVVSYLVSTSNHNVRKCELVSHLLFLILYLHQTTTERMLMITQRGLFLILYLHQTTTIFRKYALNNWLFLILYLHQTTT